MEQPSDGKTSNAKIRASRHNPFGTKLKPCLSTVHVARLPYILRKRFPPRQKGGKTRQTMISPGSEEIKYAVGKSVGATQQLLKLLLPRGGGPLAGAVLRQTRNLRAPAKHDEPHETAIARLSQPAWISRVPGLRCLPVAAVRAIAAAS